MAAPQPNPQANVNQNILRQMVQQFQLLRTTPDPLATDLLELSPDERQRFFETLDDAALFRMINPLTRRHRYEECLLYWAEILSRKGDLLSPVLRRGYSRSLFLASRYAEAADQLTLAIEADPSKHEWRISRGAAYSRIGRFEDAVDDFTFLLKSHPTVTNYFRRASMYQRMRCFDRMLEDYTSALQLSPNDWQILADRGLFYSMIGRDDLAAADFSISQTELESSRQGLVDADYLYSNVSIANLMHCRYDEAIESLSQMIQVAGLRHDHQTVSLALWRRCFAFCQIEHYSNARNDLFECMEVGKISGEKRDPFHNLHSTCEMIPFLSSDFRTLFKVLRGLMEVDERVTYRDEVKRREAAVLKEAVDFLERNLNSIDNPVERWDFVCDGMEEMYDWFEFGEVRVVGLENCEVSEFEVFRSLMVVLES